MVLSKEDNKFDKIKKVCYNKQAFFINKNNKMRRKRIFPMTKKEKKIFLWFMFFLISIFIYQVYNDIWPLILFFLFLIYYYLKKKNLIRKEDISFKKDKGFYRSVDYKDTYYYKNKINNNLKEIDNKDYTKKIDNIVLETKESINKNFVYKKKEFLLTKTELKFYNFLNEIISNEYTIMCSVRLIDILQPVYKKDIVAKNKVIQKQIDFLVCSKGYLNPILAIELNDSSHKQQKRYERDNFLDLAFQSAWLPLLFISTNDMNKTNYLKSIFSDFIKVI